jgi:hypothetical protein
MAPPKQILYLGDAIALLAVTIAGFITHGETELSFLPRFLAAFIPLISSWLLLAPWFGIFEPELASNPRQLWRPLLAMLFAAPLAVVVRGLILNAAILPIFALVLAVASAFGIAVWRGLYIFLKIRLY